MLSLHLWCRLKDYVTFVFSIHPFSSTKQGVPELLPLPLDLIMLPGRRDWMAKPPHLASFHAKELLQAPQISELLPPSLPLTPKSSYRTVHRNLISASCP